MSLKNQAFTRTYFPELDGVRALAIGMVMLFHLDQSGVLHIPGPIILGQTGVDLFFVLSGFLITGILLGARQYDRNEVRTFYVRRTLRIFPLYYAVLIALVLLKLPTHFSFWLYLQNFWITFAKNAAGPNHFWSLAVEEQFYLVWPFIVLFLPRRFLYPILACLVILSLTSRMYLFHRGIGSFYFTFARVDALAGGAALAYMRASGKLHRFHSLLATIAILSISGISLLAYFASHAKHALLIQTVKLSLFSALYTSSIGLLLTTRLQFVPQILGHKSLRFVGRISYGLYIFHPFVFGLTMKYGGQFFPVIRFVLAITVTFIVALLSWHLFEKRFILLKDRLAPEHKSLSRPVEA